MTIQDNNNLRARQTLENISLCIQFSISWDMISVYV